MVKSLCSFFFLVILILFITGCPTEPDSGPEPNPGQKQVVFPSVAKIVRYDSNGIPTSYRIQFGMKSPSKEINFTVGSDMTVFTSDDRLAGYWYSWGEQENYRGCFKGGMGVDLRWLTGDDQYDTYEAAYSPSITGIYDLSDTLIGYYKETTDANGNRLQLKKIIGRGGDIKWFTSDDIPAVSEWYGGGYYNSEYLNPPPEPVYWFAWSRLIAYDDPGDNLVWYDSDDHASVCMTHEFANGGYFCTKEIRYNCVDGKAFNGNDEMSGYSEFTYYYEGSGGIDATGSWNGIYYNTSTNDCGTFTCTLAQAGTNISGSGTFHSDTGSGDLTGEITGTINGHILTLVCKEAAAVPGDNLSITAEIQCENIIGSYDYKGSLNPSGQGMLSLQKKP